MSLYLTPVAADVLLACPPAPRPPINQDARRPSASSGPAAALLMPSLSLSAAPYFPNVASLPSRPSYTSSARASRAATITPERQRERGLLAQSTSPHEETSGDGSLDRAVHIRVPTLALRPRPASPSSVDYRPAALDQEWPFSPMRRPVNDRTSQAGGANARAAPFAPRSFGPTACGGASTEASVGASAGASTETSKGAAIDGASSKGSTTDVKMEDAHEGSGDWHMKRRRRASLLDEFRPQQVDIRSSFPRAA